VTETTDDLLTLSRLRALVKSGTAKAVRSAAGLSIAEMARAADVSERSIYRWERAQSVPHGPAALRYARLLDRLMGRAA
jgi:DNA-binding transcriptional regulator YiaG